MGSEWCKLSLVYKTVTNLKPKRKVFEDLATAVEARKDLALDFAYRFIPKSLNSKNRDDFRELVAGLESGKDIKNVHNHMFRVYDINNDGYIDHHEYMELYLLIKNRKASMKEVLAKVFRFFDINCDGAITKTEMKKVIKDVYCNLKTCNSIKKRIANDIFEEIDENGDGEIDLEEFEKACQVKKTNSHHLAIKIIRILLDIYNFPGKNMYMWLGIDNDTSCTTNKSETNNQSSINCQTNDIKYLKNHEASNNCQTNVQMSRISWNIKQVPSNV